MLPSRFLRLAFLWAGSLLYVSGVQAAQTVTASATPSSPTGGVPAAVTPTDAETSQAVSETEEDLKELEAEEKPFTPHWSGQTGLTYTNKLSQQGQGQVQKELSLTGTYDITEEGHYFSVGVVGGQQFVEGTDADYGQLNLEGGLGIDFFLPSLELEMQQGASALESNTAILTLNFRPFDPLEIGPLLSAGLQSHQGPVSTFGTANLSDRIKEVDTGNISGGLVITYLPSDSLTLSLTGQQEYDDTYQIQNVVHTVQHPLNQRDRIPSITLGENILFSKNYELDLSEQGGEEFLPAGTVYSPILGRTVTNVATTTQDFFGFSIALMYNFE